MRRSKVLPLIEQLVVEEVERATKEIRGQAETVSRMHLGHASDIISQAQRIAEDTILHEKPGIVADVIAQTSADVVAKVMSKVRWVEDAPTED